MIIDCISDLHGYYPPLEGGDLLIVAGDLTAHDYVDEHDDFEEWLENQSYKKIIFIAGNHDNFIKRKHFDYMYESAIPFKRQYLCDSGIEFEWEEPDLEYGYEDRKHKTAVLDGPLMLKTKKFKIWGSPWSKTFDGMNPKAMAFTVNTEEELAEKFAQIPDDTDILVCHTPFLHMLDQNMDGYHCGSMALRDAIDRVKPRLFVCGHIHEQGGSLIVYKQPGIGTENNTICVNASHVNEYYRPVNKPLRIEL
jgi:Icc-related predicted phosphoesterase